MLATSVRVRPWSALCRLSSEGRRTMIASPSTATARSAWTSRLISPLGPFTVIRRPSSCAVTPLGMGTGFLPMRDMGGLLPDQREQLAAHPGGARFTVGHEPLRRRQDRHPEAVLDARDLARFDVAAQARRGHTLERADHRGVVVILEVEPQQPVTPVVQHLEILDVVVVAEQPRDLDLQLRHRHVDPAVPRLAGVAHPGQHIGDGINHTHLAFRPLPTGFAHAGNFPAQRELAETNAAQPELAERAPAAAAALAPVVAPHFELRLPLDLLHPRLLGHDSLVSYATTATGASPRKGIPSSRSRARAVSSRPALVTSVISIPWIFSTLS